MSTTKPLKPLIRCAAGGVAPTLTDEEIITMEICREYFKCATDKDLYGYFRAHYRHFFRHRQVDGATLPWSSQRATKPA